MLLIDMSNLVINAVQAAAANKKIDTLELNDQIMRHIVLKSIADIHKKIGRHHKVVLCYDSRNYWRKDYFPQYKGNRNREDGKFSWEDFYKLYNEIKVEIPLYFNYKSIEVDRCEADDIIYCISDYERGNDIIIVSSDTDDLQILEKYPNAMQYSIKRNSFITCADYNYTLLDHIIEGDGCDAIANILSDSDTHVNPDKRSARLTKQRRAKLKFIISEEYKERYNENKKLIDMSQIPDNYREQIIEEYLKDKPQKIGNPLEYCIKYKLNNLFKFLN